MIQNTYYFHACRNEAGAVDEADARADWNRLTEEEREYYPGYYYFANYAEPVFVEA